MIVSVYVSVPQGPVTVNVTVNVPVEGNTWIGSSSVEPAEPSPKSQLYESIVPDALLVNIPVTNLQLHLEYLPQ